MVETAIFSQYGPVVKPTGVAIYCLLLSQANDRRECEVTIEFICASLDLAKGTAIKYLSMLETYRLIGKLPMPDDRRRVKYTLPAITDPRETITTEIGANFEPISEEATEIGSKTETSSNSAPNIGSKNEIIPNSEPNSAPETNTPSPTPPSPNQPPKGVDTQGSFVPSGRKDEPQAMDTAKGQEREPSGRSRGQPHPETRRLMDCYALALARPGNDIPVAGQNGKAAKEMLTRGYTVEQVMGCYGWIKSDPWWAHKLVTLTEVQKQIGEWINAGQPKTWVRPGDRPGVGRSTSARNPGNGGGAGQSRRPQPHGGDNLAELARRDEEDIRRQLAERGIYLPADG